MCNDVLGIHDLDIVANLDVAGGNDPLSLPGQRQDSLATVVHLQHDAFQIEDQVDDILAHAVQGGILVQHTLDVYLGRRRAGHRRKQDAAQGVAERVAITALERFHDDARMHRGEGLHIDDARFQQRSRLHLVPFRFVASARLGLARIQFDDQAFVDRRRQFSASRVGLEHTLACLGIDLDPLREAA